MFPLHFLQGVLRELVIQLNAEAPPKCAHQDKCELQDSLDCAQRCRGNVLARIARLVYTLLLTHHKVFYMLWFLLNTLYIYTHWK
jgi:hypothetical protein